MSSLRTRKGHHLFPKWLEVTIVALIITSVLVVILESVDSISLEFHSIFIALEWFFTILFTIEYIARLAYSKRPMAYATSFMGVVDIMAFAPIYIGFLVFGSGILATIRLFKLIRALRIFKILENSSEAEILKNALISSKKKIFVFIVGLVVVLTIVGAVMYIVESGTPGFENIPKSIYWAIVTMSTVGYGDVVPLTVLGKIIASLMILLGYGVIAVPTGLVTAEITKQGIKSKKK